MENSENVLDENAGITAIIPAYNESLRIGEVIRTARQFLPVLVVDDGSTDDTAEISRLAGANIISYSPNRGKGAALRAGFTHVLSSDCKAAVTLDADGQHDPGDIPGFLAYYRKTNSDLIIGMRDFRDMPLTRRLANSLGQLSFSWAVGGWIPDNQSGFRLLSKRLMEQMLISSEMGFEFEVEMIVRCIQMGYHLEWVPIRTIYTGESSHIKPLKHIKEFTRMVILTRRMRDSI
ncbi:MAG: glycosyltransferase family 2 protein [Anaerolineales bacterium]|jgi:glycosyltransferase involved in cell wall biosynthesis